MGKVKRILKISAEILRKKSVRSALLGVMVVYCVFSVNPSVFLYSETAEGSKDKIHTPESRDKADGQKNFSPEGQSHLAEAGKFEVRGDPTVWVLIFLFNLGIAVAIERIIFIIRRGGKNEELVDILTSGLSKNPQNVEALMDKINHKKYGSEGKIAFKTLQGWKFGEKAMKEFAYAGMESERRLLDKRLVVLSTLGNNTPFIGLLGTVLGIMKAFRDLATMGDAGPAVVMKGISEALIATAFGLGVAIPCVIAFNALNKKVKAKMSNAEEIVNMVVGIRLALDENQGKPFNFYNGKTATAQDVNKSGVNTIEVMENNEAKMASFEI